MKKLIITGFLAVALLLFITAYSNREASAETKSEQSEIHYLSSVNDCCN